MTQTKNEKELTILICAFLSLKSSYFFNKNLSFNSAYINIKLTQLKKGDLNKFFKSNRVKSSSDILINQLVDKSEVKKKVSMSKEEEKIDVDYSNCEYMKKYIRKFKYFYLALNKNNEYGDQTTKKINRLAIKSLFLIASI
jgi:hypothetical protein